MFTYYCSNYDEVKTADKKGWWVAYRTESTDEGAILIPENIVPNGIHSEEEALEALKIVMDWEWDEDYFNAFVRNFGYQEKDL